MTRAARLSGIGKEFDALVAATSSTMVHYSYNATAGQTSFSGADINGVSLNYTVGSTIVALNGFILQKTVDYAATTGTSVVLTEGAALGDLVQIVAFGSFLVANCYTKAESDAKIVGTVSQVGGVPTGAIIETGSNANGSWTKYADGQMVCQFTRSFTGAVNTAYGSCFFASISTRYAFPQAFVGAMPWIDIHSQGAGLWTGTVGLVSLTEWPEYYIISAVTRPSGTITDSFIARGRWY